MYISETPVGHPGHCLITGSIRDGEGFAVISSTDDIGTLSFSGGGVRHLVKLFGHASKEDHAEALDKVALLTSENEQIRAELEEAKETIAHIDALESAGFRARHKSGPRVKA